MPLGALCRRRGGPCRSQLSLEQMGVDRVRCADVRVAHPATHLIGLFLLEVGVGQSAADQEHA